MKIGKKVALGLILITGVSLVTTSAIIGSVSVNDGREMLQEQAKDKLFAFRGLKQKQIEEYFAFIRKQVQTFSRNEMIVNSMSAFNESFHQIEEDLVEVDYASFRQSLGKYYQNEFSTQFEHHNPGSRGDADSWLNQLSDKSLAFQHQYIAANPNPLGSKNVLSDAADGSAYADLHARYHPIINDYLDKFGYYDIFLVDAKTGHVVYSVFKELDYATSLFDGPFASSGLGRVFQQAVKADTTDATFIADFSPYAPSYMDSASFIASPIFDDDTVSGVLIFQMPVDRINGIMNSDGLWQQVGLGKSGESYLVGSDRKMRSNNRGLLENREAFFTRLNAANVDAGIVAVVQAKQTTTGLLPIATELAEQLTKEASGFSILKNYLGEEVLSAFAKLKIKGLDWAIVSEIETAEAFAPAKTLSDKIVYFSLFITGLFVLLSAAVGVIFARRMSKPIQQNVRLAHSIAEGELFHIIEVKTSKDEIGQLQQALSSMTNKLRAIVGHVHSGAANVEYSASEIAEGNADLARRTEQQASSLENTASTINELTATAKQNAENAGQASTLANSMQQNANEGKDTVKKVSDAMSFIKESSSRISEIVTVVEEIAFQTNLLALNAAVEAARAGDQGKGFAVVAKEVRNLAQRSTSAVGQIEALVTESVHRVDIGEKLVAESGDSLERILESVDQVLGYVQAIYDANEEQAESIDDVNRAIQQIDGITQENAALVEEAAVASQTLKDQAAELTRHVEYFKVQKSMSGDQAIGRRAA